MNLIYILDLLGTFVFASTGAIRGIEKRLDIFGILVAAFLTAVGGGTIRDVVLNQLPFYFFDENYIFAILSGTIFVIIFRKIVTKYSNVLVYLDAIGLGVFSIVGAIKGLNYGLSALGILFTGLITGIGGGIVRDILVREIPFVLEKEIYATASIIGILTFIALSRYSGYSIEITTWISIVLIWIIRILAFELKINLPKF